MARLLEGCHIKSQSFCGLSPSHLSQCREWKIFGSALALSHSCLSPTQRAEHSPSSLLKGVRSFCITHSSAETQPLLPEVGNHKHVASTLHKSGGWGNKDSLVLCVLNNTHQTPAPTPNSTKRHPGVNENTKHQLPRAQLCPRSSMRAGVPTLKGPAALGGALRCAHMHLVGTSQKPSLTMMQNWANQDPGSSDLRQLRGST